MMESERESIELLRRIERNQQEQMARQERALELQERQFEMARRQFERAEKLQDRAEKMQDSGAAMMHTARKALAIVLPIVFVLIVYLSWLIFR